MTNVVCPVCKGPVWDNREKKKNPKAPDYKCKDKACSDNGGIIWPPRGAKSSGWTAAKPTNNESVKLLQSIDTSLKRLLAHVELKNDPLEKEASELQEELPEGV